MKKNVLLVSGLAGIILLTWAATFASTSSGNTAKGKPMMQGMFGECDMGKWGKGMKWWMGMEMGMWPGSGNRIKMEAIQAAIKNGDYTAYTTAYTNAMMSKTEFAEVVNMQKKKDAEKSAIEKGDYTAFIAAIAWTPKEGKVTEDQFKDMVAKHTQRTAMRDAVINNDYTAFTAAVKGTDMEGKVTQEQFATMVQREQDKGQKDAE